ncbi:cysteine desulfurase family protein [Geotalea daltonii FRC-32]|uniref:cysteine desulfurase n=1 Tax=Geotalea daltonii (strain DSM 22248 / JCM 15807 / FRC-32) TaxID=316067 RepID=B9M2T1_GEODF|nr:aminotransferase class V-fold PLP-dependent enzyme [Geotalea daltonii]ACM21277.1 cysteine desulfurase family protein [Geotalea daltonii FRC-32]
MSVYLDNAATTFPKPDPVYGAVEHALREIGVGPGRGGYKRSLAASRLVFEAREILASFFGITDSSRLVFTHSATEGLNIAVNGLLKPGDHVVTTTMEHNSLVRPLYAAKNRGVQITWVSADRNGSIDPAAISAALRPETKLIALSHCSNVTGTIQPIASIGDTARKAGVFFLVDAAQSAGCMPINIMDQKIDLLAVPGHKGLLGPQGTGLLYIAEHVDLSPFLLGGTGTSSSDTAQPETMPEKFESGTLNTPGIAGLKAGVEFILKTGIDNIRQKEIKLVSLLLDGLKQLPRVKTFTAYNAESRGGAVSFTVEGIDPATIGFHLDADFDISVRVGLHCAPMAHKTIGTYPHGTVRVSPGFFNTDKDIAFLLDALRSIIH